MSIINRIVLFNRSKYCAAIIRLVTLSVVFLCGFIPFLIDVYETPMSSEMLYNIAFLILWTIFLLGLIISEYKAYKKGVMIIGKPNNLWFPIIIATLVTIFIFASIGDNLALFNGVLKSINLFLMNLYAPGIVEEVEKAHAVFVNGQ